MAVCCSITPLRTSSAAVPPQASQKRRCYTLVHSMFTPLHFAARYGHSVTVERICLLHKLLAAEDNLPWINAFDQYAACALFHFRALWTCPFCNPSQQSRVNTPGWLRVRATWKPSECCYVKAPLYSKMTTYLRGIPAMRKELMRIQVLICCD